jgi:hypothetical protein
MINEESPDFTIVVLDSNGEQIAELDSEVSSLFVKIALEEHLIRLLKRSLDKTKSSSEDYNSNEKSNPEYEQLQFDFSD